VRDLGACAKQAQGLHEPQLLAPFAEGGSGGLDKETLDCPAAGAAGARNLLERPGVGRIVHQHAGDTQGARIFRERKLQGGNGDGPELIEEHMDEMTLPADALIEGAAAACFKDQFLEQRGHLDDAAFARERMGKAGAEIERAHGDVSRHDDGVRGAGGNPYGAMDGHDPCAGVGGDGHDSARGKDQLIAIMEM